MEASHIQVILFDGFGFRARGGGLAFQTTLTHLYKKVSASSLNTRVFWGSWLAAQSCQTVYPKGAWEESNARHPVTGQEPLPSDMSLTSATLQDVILCHSWVTVYMFMGTQTQ